MLSTLSSPLRIHTLLPPSPCSSAVLVTLYCLVELLHLPLTTFRRSLPTPVSFISSSHPPHFSCSNRPVATCLARRRCYPTFLHFCFSPPLPHSSSVLPLVTKSSCPMRVAVIAQLCQRARRLSASVPLPPMLAVPVAPLPSYFRLCIPARLPFPSRSVSRCSCACGAIP